MRRNDVLVVLLFGTLWGVSEAILGGVLYAAGVPRSSAPLCVVALAIMTIARQYRPRIGTATLLAAVAICYKGLGMLLAPSQPVYLCHLMGIATLGVAYDAMSLLWRGRHEPLFAVSTTYLGYALFAGVMTWVVRYRFWAEAGLPKVLEYVLVTGTLAALIAALVVPLCARWARALQTRQRTSFSQRSSRVATAAWTLTVIALWAVGAGLYRYTALGA